ncbi:MAG: HAMP domain-containing histidine kinase [Candidatus Gracilibacteria bacterium]|nr:HAMP domain-containing histidine kinase [Candidatus Gracilibacteria bacterium]
MNNLTKTKVKLSIIYSFIFIVIFLILGVSFFSITYFGGDNKEVEITEVIDFKNTNQGEEIDDIFILLESAIPKETFVSKPYTYTEYVNNIFYFSLGMLFLGVLFYFISFQMIHKTVQPVEESIDDMKNFIDNAGHELKTPLAVLDSSLWVMKEKGEFDEKLVQKSQDEIQRANKLIETLRDLSNFNSVSQKENFLVSQVLHNIVSKYEKEIKKMHINFNLHILDDFHLEVNKNYFEILISNLVSNAIKYNKINGSLTISVIHNTIVIEDTGIGISKDKLDKVFQRFYRVQEQRSAEGFGLGLSLVDKILKIYNWTIKVDSEYGKGTKIIVKFL